MELELSKKKKGNFFLPDKSMETDAMMQQRASGAGKKRINESILLQGPKTRLSRIKVVNTDVIAKRDLDTELGDTR